MPVVWTVLSVVAVIALGFAALWLSHSTQLRRVRAAYARVPLEVRERCLDMIAAAAADHPIAVAYVPDPREPETGPQADRLGGVPFAEEADEWPRLAYLDDGSPDPKAAVAPFLGQFRLAAPVLPAPWPGRLVSLFLRHEATQTVWAFPAAEPAAYRPLEGGPPPGLGIPLRALPWPAARTAKGVDVLPGLLQAVPGLADVLRPFGDPEGLLAQLLTGGRGGYHLAQEDFTYCGGPPALIQGPHDEKCPACGQPMRFLLQVADHVPGVQLADAGVITVYGCDSHPETLVGLLDSH